jgi:GNAT superfamily N-acetyltransferase
MNILVGPLRESDLPVADRIFRLAFGTFNGLPDPLQHGGDSDKIRTRWLADPGAAFGAAVDGALAGSNFVTRWGSVGYFGPLTVHPDFWDRGVAQKLLEPTLALFEAWGCRHTGLYTYSGSPKHLALYQKFGFWPRWLTAILEKAVRPVERGGEVSLYSQAPAQERPGLVAAAAGLTGAIYAGLDVSREIFALEDQRLGDTVFL